MRARAEGNKLSDQPRRQLVTSPPVRHPAVRRYLLPSERELPKAVLCSMAQWFFGGVELTQQLADLFPGKVSRFLAYVVGALLLLPLLAPGLVLLGIGGLIALMLSLMMRL